MTLKPAFFLASIAVFSVLGCNPTSSSDPDNALLLEAHSWKTMALTAAPPVNNGGVLITDIYDSLLKACERHKIITFKSNHQAITSTDSTACNTGAGGLYADTGTWAFNAPTLTVIHKDDIFYDTTNYTLVSVSASMLKMTWAVPPNKVPDAAIHTATQTYIPL